MPPKPKGDFVSNSLASAKATLAHAESSFPSSGAPKAPATKPATPAKPEAKVEPTLANELKTKAENVSKYVNALPKMHVGGRVKKDGAYQLKKGEHVLTEKEAKLAKKHAVMMSGIKSLAEEPEESEES